LGDPFLKGCKFWSIKSGIKARFWLAYEVEIQLEENFIDGLRDLAIKTPFFGAKMIFSRDHLNS